MARPVKKRANGYGDDVGYLNRLGLAVRRDPRIDQKTSARIADKTQDLVHELVEVDRELGVLNRERPAAAK